MRGPKNSLIKMPDPEPSELQTPEAERARKLDVKELADAIQEVGFECTECGDCCTSGSDDDPNENVVTVFPDEVRRISDNNDLKKDEIAEPNPFGGEETFEWALKRDGCGDCFFYENECGIYEDRPWICRTYPFDVSWEDSVSSTEKRHLSDSTLLVYECEGTGREISRQKALEYARRLKERKIEEANETSRLLENYEPMDPPDGHVVVHDSEGSHVVERQD